VSQADQPRFEGSQPASERRLSDNELVDGFIGNEVGGQAVMERLLGKIDMADAAKKPLLDRSGNVMTGPEGEALLVEDYLAIAGDHGPAIPIILNFIKMDEASPAFPAAKDAILTVVGGYLHLKDEG
jgi:hypothetical protein